MAQEWIDERLMAKPAKLSSGEEAPNKVSAQVDELRRRIDQLDEEIVRLLNARAACANEIGLLKSKVAMETYQPDRELDVLNHVRSVNGGPLDARAITRLFERIIDESRRLERLVHDRK